MNVSFIWNSRNLNLFVFTAWSHRIVRFLDRATGENLSEVRPIGNVCYDLDSGRMQRLLLRLVVGHRTIDGTRGRANTNDWRRSIAGPIVGNRATSGGNQPPIVRSIVAAGDRSHDLGELKTGGTTNRKVVQPVGTGTDCEVVRQVVLPIVRWHDQLHNQSCDCLTRDHARLVVRPCATGGTI
jgi:hypothetical protein